MYNTTIMILKSTSRKFFEKLFFVILPDIKLSQKISSIYLIVFILWVTFFDNTAIEKFLYRIIKCIPLKL